MTNGKSYPAMLLVILVALFFAACWVYDLRHNDCGVPLGEACGTDTECECMHGAGE